MKQVIVHFLDTNGIDLSALTSSPYLRDKDIEMAMKYVQFTSQKERLASSIFKNKYIGEYHLDENDKPVSDSAFFNISHSHGFVVFVMDKDHPIGIDVEQIRPLKESFKKYVCSKEEYESISSDEDLFKIWTSKESMVKAFGTGIKDKVAIIPGLSLNGLRTYKDKIYSSHVLRKENFVIAVSIQGDETFEITIVEEKL